MTREKATDDGERQTMREVEHTPPDGDGARAVWERGGEKAPDDGHESESDRDRVDPAHE